MEANFWHHKWERGEIGFHEAEVNPLLTSHFDKLNPAAGGRVFLPLCGKTRDFEWLLARGYRVVGAELSELAINELFANLGLKPDMAIVGELIRYSAKDIDIWVGDIFAVSAELLGPVNAIYDRAALIALPAGNREDYSSHLISITDAAPQLLIAIEYDQRLMQGPPFSVSADEVQRHYGVAYQLQSAESRIIVGGLKGKVPALENAWLLQKC